MKLTVGDVLQWKDDPKLKDDAGELMIVVELIEDHDDQWAMPHVGVLQDGIYTTWSWNVISCWCAKIADGWEE